MKTKCSHYGEGCKDCKCVFVDKWQYIENLVAYDDEIIAAGQRICGKVMCLDDDHIGRIRAATQRRIDVVRADMPLCKIRDFTEGKYRNMPLHRVW